MEQNRTKLTLVNLLALVAAGIGTLIIARTSNAHTAYAALPFLALGVLIAAISYFHMRLVERERIEQFEYDELTKSPSASALFAKSDIEGLPAQRARRQFEKYFIPGFTILLLLAEAAAVLLFWRWLAKPQPEALREPLLAAAVLAILWLVLFLLGRFSVALARLESQRLLGPVASYILADSYICAAAAASIGFVYFEFASADLYVARALIILLGVVAVESLLTLLLEIYRPRVRGKEVRLLYDSRVMGLLAQPESLFTTAAHALDYQFGFAVSQTRFFRFLQKSLAWIIVAQVVFLVLSTSLVVIEPGEESLLERFGRPVAGRSILGPGLHLKWPFPIDKIHRFRTEQIQTFEIGLPPGGAEEKEGSTVLWTVKHSTEEEFNLLVASRETGAATNRDGARKIPPVNLLSVGIPVQFQITNLSAWAYNNVGPDQLLEKLATREVVRYLVSADVNEIMSVERGNAAEALRKRIQASADERQLGARVIFVGLQDIHPPVAVAGAYENVVGALQTREAKILSAQAQATRTNASAMASAYKALRDAEAQRDRTKALALANAAAFTNQIPAYRAAPSVYTQRAYLKSLARNAGSTRKYVIATTNTDDVILFNLEEKLRTDLLDVPTPATTK
jgi:modulator of FtsH protease HflK